jgi:hypothetical protein
MGPVKPHINICIPIAKPNAVLLIFKLSLKSIKNNPKVCLTPSEIKTTKHAANKVTIAVLDLKKFSDIISNVLMLV